MECLVCNTGCGRVQIHRGLYRGFGDDRADALGERCGVEFGANDLVGAVSEAGDAPVADEGNELLGLRGLDLTAEVFGAFDAVFAFYIDEDEVVVTRPELVQRLFEGECGVDVKALEAENMIAEGANRLSRAHVKDGAFFRQLGHDSPLFLVHDAPSREQRTAWLFRSKAGVMLALRS